eukprot:gene18262-20082_t
MDAAMLLLTIFFIFSQCDFMSAKRGDDDIDMKAYSSFALPLQHAFGTGAEASFSPRGSIVFKTLRTSMASLAREVTLTQEEYDKLDELVRNDGIYRIRSPAKIGDSFDKEDVPYVSTFVKACHLVYSNLAEIITVSIDNSGSVIGISLRTEKKECPQDIDAKMDTVRTFNTTINVQLQTAGAGPETQAFIRRIEKEEADKLAGKDKDNRSFLAKYWMYILPVVFIFMMAGQQEPESGQT